jgi:magnesium-transporting ATPase (P-type)
MIQPPPYIEKQQLVVTPQAQKFLNSSANWARFLAIFALSAIFIVAIGTYILSLIWSNASNMSNLPNVQQDALSEFFKVTTVSTIVFIVMTVFYFYSIYQIIRFTGAVKRAIKYSDSNTLTEAFGYLKAHYKSMGIMMIIGIMAYILMAIVMGLFMIYAMGALVNTF